MATETRSGAGRDIAKLDLRTLRERISKRELSAVEVTEAFLDRITALDGKTKAFLYVDREGALNQASAVDRKLAAGQPLGRLAGVPIAIKDNLCMRGLPTTCASRILEGYIPPYDAHVIERLRAEDAVLLGKTNLDEFAMGSSNENSAFGAVHNPWDLSRAPGGSSGGSAAAVAAGLAVGALGSDTGGSVRQPAAFCGIAALKPTYGRVSRFGLIAFASSLDQVGPFGRTTRDAAALLSAIQGPDPRDATCAREPAPDYERELGQDVRGLRIGIVRDSLGKGCDPEVAAATEAALKTLEKLGCRIVDVALPSAQYAIATYYLIAPAEASSNLARFDGMRYGLRVEGENLLKTYMKTRAQGFGPEVKRRIMLGTYALSAGYYDAYYLKALKARTVIRNDYAKAFEACDVIVTPTSPTPAFKLGERVEDPLAMYMADIFTLPPSLAGLPALATSAGFTKSGLPIGIQFTAPVFDEARLVRVGDAFDRSAGFHEQRPREFFN